MISRRILDLMDGALAALAVFDAARTDTERKGCARRVTAALAVLSQQTERYMSRHDSADFLAANGYFQAGWRMVIRTEEAELRGVLTCGDDYGYTVLATEGKCLADIEPMGDANLLPAGFLLWRWDVLLYLWDLTEEERLEQQDPR